ncbi:MAG: molecular chaperone TorD family protein [Anaerolineales bacterium]|nr:molecular chaperone TorD family protein [Anaerolineales bacterium]
MDNFNVAEFNELISERSSMYGFLGRIYRVEADQELLDQMAKMHLSDEVEVPEISEGYRMLRGFLEHLTESTLIDLAVEYAKIFLGVGLIGDKGAYPYESVYTSPDGLMMQEARDEVLKIYREEGLNKADEFTEPEDHVAFELDFMAYLCDKTIEVLKEGDNDGALGYLKKQMDFLEKHLIPWVPSFCSDVIRMAQGDFYKAIAKITVGYLSMEQDLIGEIIGGIPGNT